MLFSCHLYALIYFAGLWTPDRYGKFFVLDLLDVDGLWEGVQQQMNLVQKDLLKDLMDMSLIKQNKSVHVGWEDVRVGNPLL